MNTRLQRRITRLQEAGLDHDPVSSFFNRMKAKCAKGASFEQACAAVASTLSDHELASLADRVERIGFGGDFEALQNARRKAGF